MKPNIKRAQRVKGWMQPAELKWLAQAAQDKLRICEVGVYRGRTTRVLLDNSQAHIWCVDTWNYDIEDWPAFRRTIGKDWGRITPMRMRSSIAAPRLFYEFGAGWFDMIFIDAGHDYQSVRVDIESYRQLLRPGGLFCGHDYSPKAWKGVVRAVNELVGDFRVAGVIWYTTV
jgi:predicted O-methyltransferase YrrM